MIEPLTADESIPEVTWAISIKCNKDTKIAYGPWADRQRFGNQNFDFFKF